MVSSAHFLFARQQPNVSLVGETIGIDAEHAIEKVAAPKQGAVVVFEHGPLVEDNLSLFRASDNRRYVHGIDYIEHPAGGFENISIPAGTMVRAEYFYHAEAAHGMGGGLHEPTPEQAAPDAADPGRPASPGRGGYATILKYGG